MDKPEKNFINNDDLASLVALFSCLWARSADSQRAKLVTAFVQSLAHSSATGRQMRKHSLHIVRTRLDTAMTGRSTVYSDYLPNNVIAALLFFKGTLCLGAIPSDSVWLFYRTCGTYVHIMTSLLQFYASLLCIPGYRYYVQPVLQTI